MESPEPDNGAYAAQDVSPQDTALDTPPPANTLNPASNSDAFTPPDTPSLAGSEANESTSAQQSLKKKRPRSNLESRDSEANRGLQRSNSYLSRSNSSTFHSDGSLAGPMQPHNRTISGQDSNHVDTSKIAVISREAKPNFQQGLQDKIASNGGTIENKASLMSLKSLGNLIKSYVKSLKERTNYGDSGEGLEQWASFMLKDKEVPHLIAVIEGKDKHEQLTVNQGESMGTHTFKYLGWREGKNTKGGRDAKQNMFIYVREDLRGAYTVEEVDIPHREGLIPCLGINYQTEDNKQYQTLAVHIPNRFIGTKEKNTITHKSFIAYAEAQKNIRIVTSYIGDTNYKWPITDGHSIPSMGGNIWTENGKVSLTPFASGAEQDTHFMQHVALGNLEAAEVLQPSMLHVALVPQGRLGPGVDHPSMIGRTTHASTILGRSTDTPDVKRRRTQQSTYTQSLANA